MAHYAKSTVLPLLRTLPGLWTAAAFFNRHIAHAVTTGLGAVRRLTRGGRSARRQDRKGAWQGRRCHRSSVKIDRVYAAAGAFIFRPEGVGEIA